MDTHKHFVPIHAQGHSSVCMYTHAHKFRRDTCSHTHTHKLAHAHTHTHTHTLKKNCVGQASKQHKLRVGHNRKNTIMSLAKVCRQPVSGGCVSCIFFGIVVSKVSFRDG